MNPPAYNAGCAASSAVFNASLINYHLRQHTAMVFAPLKIEADEGLFESLPLYKRDFERILTFK
jgi:hypothetical protein